MPLMERAGTGDRETEEFIEPAIAVARSGICRRVRPYSAFPISGFSRNNASMRSPRSTESS